MDPDTVRHLANLICTIAILLGSGVVAVAFFHGLIEDSKVNRR